MTKKRWTILSAFLAFIVLAAAGAVLGGDWYLTRFARSSAAPSGAPVMVDVLPGQSLKTVAESLYSSGIITNPLLFTIHARITGDATRIKAGQYRLSPTMTPTGILDILVKGKVVLYRITIPEGFTVREIAARLEQEGFARARDVIDRCFDPSVPQAFGIDADSLEGYLFPDTYSFPKPVALDTIIRTMVHRFQSVYLPEWKDRTDALGFSIHEIVTLASIIEKETGTKSERPLIASVFHNRLRKGLRLETDPTVIYGIDDFDGNLTRKHLRTPTPYNTYLIRGLPPGPIANPGRLSIQAALFPASTDYLYFVSKNDGTHEFSTTYAQHNRAVRKYQLRR